MVGGRHNLQTADSSSSSSSSSIIVIIQTILLGCTFNMCSRTPPAVPLCRCLILLYCLLCCYHVPSMLLLLSHDKSLESTTAPGHARPAKQAISPAVVAPRS